MIIIYDSTLNYIYIIYIIIIIVNGGQTTGLMANNQQTTGLMELTSSCDIPTNSPHTPTNTSNPS